MSMPFERSMTGEPPILQFPAQPRVRRRINWHRVLPAAWRFTGWRCSSGRTFHPPRVTESDGMDKWVHLGAYLGLAILLSACWAVRRPATVQLWVKVVAVIALVGAFDEITQTLVGRDCELLDWCADVAGALGALAVIGYASIRRRNWSPPAAARAEPRRRGAFRTPQLHRITAAVSGDGSNSSASAAGISRCRSSGTIRSCASGRAAV